MRVKPHVVLGETHKGGPVQERETNSRLPGSDYRDVARGDRERTRSPTPLEVDQFGFVQEKSLRNGEAERADMYGTPRSGDASGLGKRELETGHCEVERSRDPSEDADTTTSETSEVPGVQGYCRGQVGLRSGTRTQCVL